MEECKVYKNNYHYICAKFWVGPGSGVSGDGSNVSESSFFQTTCQGATLHTHLKNKHYLRMWSTSNWSQGFWSFSMVFRGPLIHWRAVSTCLALSWLAAFQSSEVSLDAKWLETAADDMLWTPEGKLFIYNKLFPTKWLELWRMAWFICWILTTVKVLCPRHKS